MNKINYRKREGHYILRGLNERTQQFLEESLSEKFAVTAVADTNLNFASSKTKVADIAAFREKYAQILDSARGKSENELRKDALDGFGCLLFLGSLFGINVVFYFLNQI